MRTVGSRRAQPLQRRGKPLASVAAPSPPSFRETPGGSPGCDACPAGQCQTATPVNISGCFGGQLTNCPFEFSRDQGQKPRRDFVSNAAERAQARKPPTNSAQQNPSAAHVRGVLKLG
jgi:hypothetical protein